MAFNNPQQMATIAVNNGVKKATMPLISVLFLGFLGGAFIALGYLFNIRVVAGLPHEWGSLNNLIGGLVFPLGLILVIVAGAELLTGNMMAVTMGVFAKKVRFMQLLKNWVLITVTNFIGAVFVAYFFGHVLGLTETDVFLDKTVAAAQSKVQADFLATFISAVGCNWLVALGVWISYSAEDAAGKIISLFLPIAAFVTIGFQHVVANMFIIPAAIFAGGATWAEYFTNFVPVFLGNTVGGAVLVAGLYFGAYIQPDKALKVNSVKKKN
ncbi:formate/nitrite transporter family protein [Bacillus massiliglaciei]|uniref:formate/nitrite transporter family protein n=1 Tax=Bacillus massiliglaciei TaxID=1816693 RepID=UPI000A97381A|nr:formate/nitrite transporter family protein [Bacillus massiliglaciei]